ncbi:hypothetical protein ACHQM5_018983 [Ranunculus cassubicifolius]
MAARTGRIPTPNFPSPLLTSINTVLQQTLNYQQTPTNPSLLNQFSPNLNPNLVISVINSQTNPLLALFFFNWAAKPNPNPNNYHHTHYCYSAMLDHLLSHNMFSTATKFLERTNNVTDFMIGKVIKAHGDRGDIRGAMDWLNKARLLEGNCELFSYNAALGVLVRANRISLARKVYDMVEKPDVSTYTVMIRGYCKVGMIDDAKKVFDEMLVKPNSITYNTIIFGLCRKGRMESAREIMEEMIVRNHGFPDVVTFTTLIDGYCKQNELEKAEKCMDEMVHWGCEPNVLTYNSMIYGLCMNGRIDEAKRMMTKMRLKGWKDDLATHTSLLKGFCIVGRSDDAINHFKEMLNLGFKPDEKAYGVVVNEYCKMGRWTEAIVLMDQMELIGLKPGINLHNSLLRVLCNLGEHGRAIRYLKKISQKNRYVNFLAYDILICSLCSVRGKMRDVEDLVVDMVSKGHRPDISMYNNMVKGYCEDGDVHMSMGMFREMMEKGFTINLESFSVFVKELCRKGKSTEVKKLFEEMCKRCPVPDVESYRKILDENLC